MNRVTFTHCALTVLMSRVLKARYKFYEQKSKLRFSILTRLLLQKHHRKSFIMSLNTDYEVDWQEIDEEY